MFDYDLFIKLHGPVMTNDVEHTANLLYTINMVLKDNEGYSDSLNCKKTTEFLKHYKLAGGQIDPNRLY